jgi:hypothetical protein
VDLSYSSGLLSFALTITDTHFPLLSDDIEQNVLNHLLKISSTRIEEVVLRDNLTTLRLAGAFWSALAAALRKPPFLNLKRIVILVLQNVGRAERERILREELEEFYERGVLRFSGTAFPRPPWVLLVC